jgi:hypothetical protein
MPKLFNQTRVNETAAFIATDLNALLDRKNIDSPLRRRIAEACPPYRMGLTNGENELATLKALNLAALKIIADMPSMKWGGEDDEDEAA